MSLFRWLDRLDTAMGRSSKRKGEDDPMAWLGLVPAAVAFLFAYIASGVLMIFADSIRVRFLAGVIFVFTSVLLTLWLIRSRRKSMADSGGERTEPTDTKDRKH